MDVRTQLAPVKAAMDAIAGTLDAGRPASACRAKAQETAQRIARGSSAIQEWLKWVTYALNDVVSQAASQAMQDVNHGRTRTLTDEDGNILEIAEGSLYLHRPGRFRWEYRKPYEQSIIADGSVLWIYDPDLEQVTRRPLDGALSYTPAALLGNEMDLNENFLISEEGEANGLSWLLLTSRSVNDEHYNAFRLAFDEAGLRAMEMSDNFGQRTLLQFTDEHRNEKLDPSIFRFEPPLGVDVFDAASGR